MYRLNSCGSYVDISKIATMFGTGDGGTIDKITWRVFQSIMDLGGIAYRVAVKKTTKNHDAQFFCLFLQ